MPATRRATEVPTGPAFDGLHALASLDGAPLAQRDRAVLGLNPGENDVTAGFAALAVDGGRTVAGRTGGRYGEAIFLGHLDEPGVLAGRLGLDPATPPLGLASAALARWGDEAATRMPGEWSFLSWDADARALTLLASETMRDPLLYWTDGRRVAIASHVRALRGLDGVDPAPWPRGVLLHLGRAPLRRAIADETMLRGVRQATPGARTVVTAAGVRASAPRPLPPPPRWLGSFGDAVEALDATLRAILGEQMARHAAVASMLSGGLDSSLVAAYASAGRSVGQPLFAVTSAAPSGSGLADELPFARAVADPFGMPVCPVVPPTEASLFRPTARTMRWLDHAMVPPYHYLDEVLFSTAAEGGASAILDGSYGEWTVTAYPPDAGWRTRARAVRDAIRWRTARPATGDAFHVRLAPAALAQAGAELHEELAAPAPGVPPRRADDAWGYDVAGITKNAREPTTTPWLGLRRLMPFRDRRLLTLFAGMPACFLMQGGLTRAPGRALLAGKVPDAVRLRPHGLPFAPDYRQRLHRQAAAARDLIPAYRRAGLGEWIDLPWLDAALAAMAARDRSPLDTAFHVQGTATAAAFLYDWLEGGRPEEDG